MAYTIHPDPGSHHSARFTATIGGQAATVLGFARTTFFETLAWLQGDLVENSWLTYNSNSTTEVVITRLAGPVTSAIVYPKNAGVTQAITAGKLVLQVPSDVRLRIEINGDRAHVFHLFSDPYMSAFPSQYVNYSQVRRHVVSVDLNTEIVTTSLAHNFVTGQKIIWHNEPGAVAPTTSPQITEHMMLKVVKVDDTRFTLTDATPDENPISFTNAGSGGRALFPASWSDITNTLLFDTGVWPVARLFEIAADGVDIYVTGGAIVKGSFDFRSRDACTIRGPGMISGEFSTYETIKDWDQSLRYPYSMFYADSDGQWNHNNNTIEEVTVFATPYYVSRYGINRWDHVKILASHTWEQDGIIFTGRTAAPHTAEAVKCYSFTADDNIHLAEQFCQATVTGCFAIAAAGACFHAGYFPYWGDTGRSTTITDCDAMHLGKADTGLVNGSPPKGANAILRAWTDGALGKEDTGPNDFHISNIRVWGEMASRFFSIGNTLYPYGTPNDGIGEVWDWTIEDVVTETVPAQLSYFSATDAANTPHDIAFRLIYFAGTKLTEDNYLDYIDPYTIPYGITYDPSSGEPEPEPTNSAEELWAAVKVDYDEDGLITLTNIRNRAGVEIDDTVGQNAAQAILNLWPIYAQIAYDPTNQTHVEVAEFGVIAMLWRRGGSASAIDQVKWEEVFGDDGMMTRLRRITARARGVPSSNSGVTQADERLSDGSRVRGWADRESLPVNYLPQRRSSQDT